MSNKPIFLVPWRNCWTISRKDAGVTESAETPGVVAQFFALFFRRSRIFVRDGGQLLLHLAILLGFPALVVLFALKGVDAPQSLSDSLPTSLEDYQRDQKVMEHNMNLGGLISGLVMFQVILLTLMASNNSAREIAGERKIYEKEKLGGLRPAAYLSSKVAFLAVLVVVQSVWMAVFVQTICKIPVGIGPMLLFLLLVNGGMTAICLGISSLAKNADQASLLSIYLVGFQLPLSGAVLALPAFAAWATRPFISAYWSWSGIIRSLEPKPLRAVEQVTETSLMPAWLCYAVLLVHLVAGLFAAYIGVKRSAWRE